MGRLEATVVVLAIVAFPVLAVLANAELHSWWASLTTPMLYLSARAAFERWPPPRRR